MVVISNVKFGRSMLVMIYSPGHEDLLDKFSAAEIDVILLRLAYCHCLNG